MQKPKLKDLYNHLKDDYEKELKVLEKNEKILDLIVKAKDAEGDEKIQALEEIERIIYSYGI